MAAETDIARPVVERFRQDGWKVWPEVLVEGCYPDAIVHHEELRQWGVIEAKAQLDETLIEQCRRWRGVADRVWAVVPELGKVSDAFIVRRDLLSDIGIGLIVVKGDTVSVVCDALRQPNVQTSVLARAVGEHAGEPQAGNAEGKRNTARSRVTRLLKAAVNELGPCTIKDIIWSEPDIARPYGKRQTAIRKLHNEIESGDHPGLALDRSRTPALVIADTR
jgi:hypothetical protein